MCESNLRVHYLPSHVRAEDLARSTVVVIDVLRATSTISQALASGAQEVVPFLEIEAAKAAAEIEARASIVLGGERGGKRIDGFDLGNSPCEYTPEAVGGRRVFITTTNGTRAMHHARHAARVILGSFLNLSAVAASIKNEPRLSILCASTDGGETEEDILAAGAIVQQLCASSETKWQPDDAASTANVTWIKLHANAKAARRSTSAELAFNLRGTLGGRNLIAIGLDQDLVDCAQIDRLSIVPELDVRAWRITAKAISDGVVDAGRRAAVK
jgi:2-phosphosulfolactate phosphatase